MSTATAERTHFFGVRINGVLAAFTEHVDDSEFEQVTRNGLPAEWVAWHFEAGENASNSQRVREVRDLPMVIVFASMLATFSVPENATFVHCPYRTAKWREWISKE